MTITQNELNSKLEAIESRMDRRVDRMEIVFEQTQKQSEELKREFRNAKWWALGTAVGIIAVLATFLGITNSWQQAYLSSYSAKVDNLSSNVSTLQNNMSNIQNSLNAIQRALAK